MKVIESVEICYCMAFAKTSDGVRLLNRKHSPDLNSDRQQVKSILSTLCQPSVYVCMYVCM